MIPKEGPFWEPVGPLRPYWILAILAFSAAHPDPSIIILEILAAITAKLILKGIHILTDWILDQRQRLS